MSITHVVGIDPGLVHTGVVSLFFSKPERTLFVRHGVISGASAADVARLTVSFNNFKRPDEIFIEGYRPRSHFLQDKKMVEAVSKIHAALPGSKVLNNTGVTKVVKRATLELLGCWAFSTPTHHDDLRSAARIAVLGMLKDKKMNLLLGEFVNAHIEGEPWSVVAG